MQQARLRLRPRPQRSSRPLPQPYARRRGQDPLALPDPRTGSSWPGSRLMPDGSSGRRWTPTGRPVKHGRMDNWRRGPPPPRRLKKRAPNEPSGRNPPGNRNALRPPSRPGFGFRSPGNGGATAGFAAGRPRPGTTAEHRHQRLCGPGTALLLRSTGSVSWSSPQNLRKRARPSAFGAGLLSLCPMPKRILPAGSCSRAGIVFAHTGSSADDG